MTIRPLLRKLLPARARTFLKSFLTRPQPEAVQPRFLAGFREFCVGNPSHKALVSYLVDPLLPPPEQRNRTMFSNRGIAQQIPRALNELGYEVDIVQWDDLTWQPCDEYDLFVGHGGINFERIARRLPPDAVKIYFSTGIYWNEMNRAEDERFRWLEQRRGVRLPYDRWIDCSEEYANQSADGIICLGNQVAKDSYAQFPVVINLNNAAYDDERYERVEKHFTAGRDRFLFFSGGGNVHKGLDLLLESFTQMDAHLYICQHIRPDFHEVYRHELVDFPNIHLIGPVSMRSPQFYELVDTCNFVIHPTCAEGQPGSVIECMHQGLIPVVSREANMDTEDYGVTLSTCSIDEVVRAVQDLSQRSPEWCEEMSRRTRKAALTDFSEVAFLPNMRSAIKEVIARKAQRDGYGERQPYN